MEAVSEQSEAPQSAEGPDSGATLGRPRRKRSLTETLLTIVLGLEAFLMFFVTMTLFGLKVLEPAVAFSSGAVIIALLLLATRVMRYPWGVWVGWALQAVLVATGILLPVMFVIAAGFVALWAFCLVKGRQIDARNLSQA